MPQKAKSLDKARILFALLSVAQSSFAVDTKVTTRPDIVASKQVQARAAWQARILALKAPKSGCFTARYPVEAWKEIKCVPTPAHEPGIPPNLRQVPRPAHDVGNGADISAVLGTGVIASAKGSFPHVGGVQNIATIQNSGPKPDVFSLQLNSQPHKTDTSKLCSNSTNAGCSSWVQFVIDNGQHSLVFIEYWLLNFGDCTNASPIPPIPDGPTTWNQATDGVSCYFDTNSIDMPPLNSVDLRSISLVGSATLGGQDTAVEIRPDGSMAMTAFPDYFFSLASNWDFAEFNIFGFNNRERVVFNPGAELLVWLDLTYGSNISPTLSDRGFTGETNNLTLVKPGCIIGGSHPGIEFAEAYDASTLSAACPPVLKGYSGPPTVSCGVLNLILQADQQSLANKENALGSHACEGILKKSCLNQVASAQQTVAAILETLAKQCPTP